MGAMLPFAIDIEAEHRAAIASLTLDQRRAFERIAWAESRSWREGGDMDSLLQQAFVSEARARSAVLANDA